MNKIRTKEFASNQIKSIKLDANDEDLIKSYLLDPDEFDFEKSEIVAFKALMANNFRDRIRERFPVEILGDFKESIPGKLRIENHDTNTRIGKFYDAEVIEKTFDETLKLIGTIPDAEFETHLKEIQEKDGGLY